MASKLEYIAKDLQPLARPIADFVFDPRNARTHGDRNYQAVKTSLERFGQRVPIVVRAGTMEVEAGNLRLQVARDLGWTHIAAVIVDEDARSATAYGIVDNRSADLAEWNWGTLAELLAELRDDEEDLNDLGWSDYEVEPLLAGSFVPDAIPEGEWGDDHDDAATSAATGMTIVFTADQWSRLNPVLDAQRASGAGGSDADLLVGLLTR